MTYFADLTPCDYFPVESREPLLAVGCLDREHDYCRGAVEPLFVAKLFELLGEPWQPCVFAGSHECQFCRFSGGPDRVRLLESVCARGGVCVSGTFADHSLHRLAWVLPAGGVSTGGDGLSGDAVDGVFEGN